MVASVVGRSKMALSSASPQSSSRMKRTVVFAIRLCGRVRRD